MGYQPGQGLGKGASGAAVPIQVEIKSKRTGLGVDEAQKERQGRQAEMQLLRGVHRAFWGAFSYVLCTIWSALCAHPSPELVFQLQQAHSLKRYTAISNRDILNVAGRNFGLI